MLTVCEMGDETFSPRRTEAFIKNTVRDESAKVIARWWDEHGACEDK
jgi:hypothetical protein